MNFYEQVVINVFLVLVGGLQAPVGGIIAGGMIIVGRVGYTLGYLKKPRFRFPGLLCAMTGNFVALGCAIFSAIKIATL